MYKKYSYLRCDQLEKLPIICRDNWLFELDYLADSLPIKSNIIQVGCMDGTRLLSLLNRRPDLNCTGLDCEADLLELAKEKLNDFEVKLVLVDITKYRPVTNEDKFDYAICLNNTLGYIDDAESAVNNMKSLGKTVINSVYGEEFTNDLAKDYFECLGINILSVKENVDLLPS